MANYSYAAIALSRRNIEQFTEFIRTELGMRDHMFFPIIRLIELLNHYEYLEFQILDRSEMGELHGEALVGDGIIRLREDVYDGAVHGNGRDRFTAAHELGHFFMHDPASISLARIHNNSKLPAYRNPEWQANEFAGALLMPAYGIVGLSVEDIAVNCGVSRAAARVRLNNLSKQ